MKNSVKYKSDKSDKDYFYYDNNKCVKISHMLELMIKEKEFSFTTSYDNHTILYEDIGAGYISYDKEAPYRLFENFEEIREYFYKKIINKVNKDVRDEIKEVAKKNNWVLETVSIFNTLR